MRRPRKSVLVLLGVLCSRATSLIPPEQYRHEQLTAMQAAFSRFGGANDGTLDRKDLPDFLRFVVAAMNSAAVPAEQVITRSTELTQKLISHLPPEAPDQRLSLKDILHATEKILVYPEPTSEELDNERGRLGACLSSRSMSLFFPHPVLFSSTHLSRTFFGFIP